MKKQCVIITAYKNPETLRELLGVLNERFLCFVHIDKKAEDQFRGLEKEFDNVFFESKYSVNWGGVEHLYAITDLLKKISAYDYSYVHIISGEDFPTRPMDEIESFFDKQSSVFIQCQLCDVNKMKRSAWYKFYWPYAGLKHNYKNPLIRYINLLAVGLQKIFPIFQKRKLGEFEKIYTGLIWGSLPKDAVEYVLNYIESKNFMEELKWCKIPEEFFFQTILANSEFKNRIIDDNKRYGNFEDGDGSGPTYLKMEDVTKADAKGAFFARKIGKNTEVINFLKGRQAIE